LVGLLCDHCKTSEVAMPEIQKIIKTALEELPREISSKYQEPYKIFHSKGCPVCKGKGILGRTALYEVLEMTPGLENVIVGGPTLQKILKEAHDQKMVSLRQDGVLKALDGRISIEEVVRETQEL
jgi:general secretion pathway protein E